MLRTHYSKEITPSMENEKVNIAGWVRSIREHGNLKFLILADRSGEIQITAKKGEVSDKILKQISSLGREYVLLVSGKVRKSEQAPRNVEILPEKIDVLSKAESPLPLDFKVKAGLDKRLDWRPLDLRKSENMAIFMIQSKLVEGMEEYLRRNGFVQVFTPCLIGATSEGGSDIFPVIYFQQEAFLRQDPQLHRELVIASGFDKIYDLGPSWRAEPSHTTRHLCEHRGCAAELAFIKDETDVMRIQENLVISALKAVKKDCQEELKLLNKDIDIPKKPFPELRFPNIYDILENMGKKIEYEGDLDRESEILLAKYVQEKYKHDFFFINRFPSKIKPFYVMFVDEDPQWARSIDLMYKNLELSSGGQREHRYEKIIQQAKKRNMPLESIKWFTEFFKYGVPPMGGFNLGIERITQMFLELENIREAVLFPRAPERLLP